MLCISIQFEWNPLMEMNNGLEDFKKKNKLQPPTNKIRRKSNVNMFTISFNKNSPLLYI